MVSPYLDFLSGIRIFFKKNLYQVLEIKENQWKFTVDFFESLVTFYNLNYRFRYSNRNTSFNLSSKTLVQENNNYPSVSMQITEWNTCSWKGFAMVATLFLRQFLINLLVSANVLRLQDKIKKLIYFNVLSDIS